MIHPLHRSALGAKLEVEGLFVLAGAMPTIAGPSHTRAFVTVLVVLSLWIHPRSAAADASSFMALGGGAAHVEQTGLTGALPGLLQMDLGAGTSPANPFVFGGVLRTSTFFGHGTDVALLQRTATRGYAMGDYGLAVDLGGYQRWWGAESTGFAASVNLGAPWGVNLGLNGAFGNQSAMMLGLVLSVDWARMTAHRRSGEGWWPNYRLPLEAEPSARY